MLEIYKYFNNSSFESQLNDEILDYIYYDISQYAYFFCEFDVYRKYQSFIKDNHNVICHRYPICNDHCDKINFYNNIMKEIKDDYDAVVNHVLDNTYKLMSKNLKNPVNNKMMSIYQFQWYYSFAIPNNEVIEYLSEFLREKKCIEIGAGRGLWALLLYLYGDINIICYDDFSWFIKNERLHSYYPIKNTKYTDIDYGADVMMLIWPPPEENDNIGSDLAYSSLNKFGGRYIIFVGERSTQITLEDGSNGRLRSQMGNYKFHDELNEKWDLIKEIEIPNLFYMSKGNFLPYRDKMYIFEKIREY